MKPKIPPHLDPLKVKKPKLGTKESLSYLRRWTKKNLGV